MSNAEIIRARQAINVALRELEEIEARVCEVLSVLRGSAKIIHVALAEKAHGNPPPPGMTARADGGD